MPFGAKVADPVSAAEQIGALSVEPRSSGVELDSKSVEPPADPNFTLRATRTGIHRVRLRAKSHPDSDATAEKTIDVEVREVGDVSFESAGHHVPEDADLKGALPYLVDSEAHVEISLQDSNGEPLLGAGRYPVEWKPEEALTSDRKPTEGSRMVFETASQPGTVTLRSKPGSGRRQIELITPSMVEDLALAERALLELEADSKLPIEGLWAAHFVPVFDGVLILDSSLDVSVSSDTPDVCKVRSQDRVSFEKRTGRSVQNAMYDHAPGNGAVVEIVGNGRCRLHAELPEANGGSGASRQTELLIDR